MNTSLVAVGIVLVVIAAGLAAYAFMSRSTQAAGACTDCMFVNSTARLAPSATTYVSVFFNGTMKGFGLSLNTTHGSMGNSAGMDFYLMNGLAFASLGSEFNSSALLAGAESMEGNGVLMIFNNQTSAYYLSSPNVTQYGDAGSLQSVNGRALYADSSLTSLPAGTYYLVLRNNLNYGTVATYSLYEIPLHVSMTFYIALAAFAVCIIAGAFLLARGITGD